MFAAVRGSGDRKRTAGDAKGDRKRTAASPEWMSDNHGERPEIELVHWAWDALTDQDLGFRRNRHLLSATKVRSSFAGCDVNGPSTPQLRLAHIVIEATTIRTL